MGTNLKHNNHSIILICVLPLLIVIWVGCSPSTSSPPDDTIVDVPGCIDSMAVNYSDLATMDDGSCQYLGCTDSTAINYDPMATIDDGNCVPISEIPDDWTLAWNDEFNLDSIDTDKWNHENWWPGYVNNELQSYSDDPANSYVRSGLLNIVMRKANPFDVNNPAYNSARMNTSGKGDWIYGRFEIKAKLPAGRGMWPAIWMMPTESVYGPWPVSGEIDIMELLGHETDRVHGSIHYGDYYPNHTSATASYKLNSGDFSTDFHLFALEWELGVLRWYVDDTLFQTRNTWFSEGGSWPAPFDQDFHIILNVALGGDWAGPPNESTLFPQSMQVDYVRVYEK
jgi:beta-glucanase (GH16 family)